MKLFQRLKRIMLALLVMALVFVAMLIGVPIPLEKLNAPQAYRYYDRNGELINLLISSDGYLRMKIPVNDVSPLFIKTLLLYEDKYFYSHVGVNPASMVRAGFQNMFYNHRRIGASTITMQLARMLQRRQRTYWAKIVESFRALQLEMRYHKDELLSYYLAIAPYGGNIEGLQAASNLYFNKSAKQLSVGEIALLVSIPKSPNTLRPDKHPANAKKRRDKILALMLANKLITKSQHQRALLEPVKVKRLPLVNEIPHTAWRHRLKHPEKYRVKTTIDLNTQTIAKKLLANHLERLKQYNIGNGAVVVIDNKTRDIRALVGSVDYFSRKNLGANNGAFAARSPGSTLKPFLYGLAIEKGLVAEKSVLYDLPINVGGYAPQNFNGRFNGLVTVREALKQSLNTVVISLYRQLGVHSLHDLLQRGGITTLSKPAEYYGLPLALGGVDVRLLELTNLYASLANEGVYQPYRLIQSGTDSVNDRSKRRLLSAESSWIITNILTDVSRPDFPASWQFSKKRATVAWKTGTSYGNRDAWSIGYTKHYTVGVWLGNFNASRSKALVGGRSAAPILFDIIQGLEPGGDHGWFAKPAMVKKRKVCALSGKLPTRFCPLLKTEYHVAGIGGPANTEHCDIHQNIVVKAINSPTGKPFSKIYEVWPPKIARYFYKHGQPVDRVPAYKIENMTAEAYYKPVIVSPKPNTEYVRRLDRLSADEHGIRLSAAVTNRVKKVFWFLNGRLIQEAKPYEDIIINPAPGTYQLTLMDDVGGTASVKLRIKDHRSIIAKKYR